MVWIQGNTGARHQTCRRCSIDILGGQEGTKKGRLKETFPIGPSFHNRAASTTTVKHCTQTPAAQVLAIRLKQTSRVPFIPIPRDILLATRHRLGECILGVHKPIVNVQAHVQAHCESLANDWNRPYVKTGDYAAFVCVKTAVTFACAPGKAVRDWLASPTKQTEVMLIRLITAVHFITI
jgi:hypothetical protein